MAESQDASIRDALDPGSVDYWRDRAFECLAELKKANDTSERFHAALTEIRMLTVEVGDSVEAATRACDIAMEALGE